MFVSGLTQIILAELIRGSPWIIVSNRTAHILLDRTSIVVSQSSPRSSFQKNVTHGAAECEDEQDSLKDN